MVIGDDTDRTGSDTKCHQSAGSNTKWWCDRWTPRPTANDYLNNLDKTELDKFESDQKEDVGDRDVEKFVKKPYGWGNGISKNEIGLTKFVIDEVKRDQGNIENKDCDADLWC